MPPPSARCPASRAAAAALGRGGPLSQLQQRLPLVGQALRQDSLPGETGRHLPGVGWGAWLRPERGRGSLPVVLQVPEVFKPSWCQGPCGYSSIGGVARGAPGTQRQQAPPWPIPL